MFVVRNYNGYDIVKDGIGNFQWSIYENYNKDGEHRLSLCETLEQCKVDIDNNSFLFGDAQPLNEFLEQHEDDYGWESTLEEDLIEEDWFNE